MVSGGTWPATTASAFLFAAGAGVGFGFGPVLAAVLARIPTDNAADASGALNTTAQLGYLTGVSVFGSWFLGTAQLPAALPAAQAFEPVGFTLAAVALAAAVLAAFPTRPRPSQAQAAMVLDGPGKV